MMIPNKLFSLQSAALIVTLAILLPETSQAVIAPHHHKQSQESAAEQLSIHVDEVKVALCESCEEQAVEVQATVTKVSKTSTGLKVGVKIQIKYKHFSPKGEGWAGPRPIPILLKGATHPAFLKRAEKGSHYLPAAMGYSFELLNPPEQRPPKEP